MSDTTGFRIVIKEGNHTLKISNTEKTGYVTFTDSGSGAINLPEERFIDLAKYLGIEAEKIKKSIKAKKPVADFKVENPEEKKKKRKKIPENFVENSEAPNENPDKK